MGLETAGKMAGILRTWWQGGERYAENVSPDGSGKPLELVFTGNAIYSALIWQQLTWDVKLHFSNWSEIFGNRNPVNLEIGIGNGEFIADKAAENPDENWVGVEVFKKIFHKAASRAAKNKVGNIRILQFDAYLILRLFPDAFLKNIYVNFPDPWPKNQHKRRRLLKTPFIALAASKLASGGCLHIATDHEDYAHEIEANLAEVSSLKSAFDRPYLPDIDGYFPTKYFKKFASTNGAYFFRYIKQRDEL